MAVSLRLFYTSPWLLIVRNMPNMETLVTPHFPRGRLQAVFLAVSHSIRLGFGERK
jgi:hypothetical protein